MNEPKRMGRPPGKDYPVHQTMLLTESDRQMLLALSVEWNCSNAEVVRRLIREEGKRAQRRRRISVGASSGGDPGEKKAALPAKSGQ